VTSQSPNPANLDELLVDELDHRREQQLLRSRVPVRVLDSTHLEIDGRRFTNFASNNYLGLTHHPLLLKAAEQSLQAGAGSGAAGLISGYTELHQAAEQTIAQWKNTQACVLLPSGYQANLAAVQTIAAGTKAGVRFLLDKLVHASLVDAVRASGAPMRIFPHNHLGKLRRLLEEAPSSQMQVVVTESIFSMDGDAADLAGLAEIKRKRPFVLLLDEAHASGIYGPGGAGLAAEMGLSEMVDVSVVTLSKAMGCVGGAVCGSRVFCEAAVNFGRAYVYSTSVPPMVAGVARAAVGVCQSEPGRRERARFLAGKVRGELGKAGMKIPEGDSPIIPVIFGEAERALQAAERLKEKGFLVVAVRPPTVARGGSRVRLTISCDHTDGEVAQLMGAMRGIVGEMGTPR
jgi:8-amino-7-oxononanoate synthase